jgi:hypothetical protein
MRATRLCVAQTRTESHAISAEGYEPLARYRPRNMTDSAVDFSPRFAPIIHTGKSKRQTDGKTTTLCSKSTAIRTILSSLCTPALRFYKQFCRTSNCQCIRLDLVSFPVLSHIMASLLYYIFFRVQYCCISLIFVRYLRRVRTISVVRTVVAAVCEAHYKGISAHFVHRIACYYRTAAAILPHRTYITLWLASIAPALHNNVRRLSEQSIVGIVYTT